MRVLHVTENYPPTPCGVGDYVKLLAANERTHNGIESFVYAGNGLADSGVVIGPLTVSSFTATLQDLKPDVVNFHVAYSPAKGLRGLVLCLLLPHIAYRAKVHILVTYHQFPDFNIGLRSIRNWKFGVMDILRVPIDWLCARAFGVGHRFVERFVVVDGRYRDLMSKHMRERSVEIDIPSNIDVASVSSEEVESFKNAMAMGEGKWIGFFGFLYREKGFEYLLDVLKSTNYKLLYVGKLEPDTAYRKKVLNLLNESLYKERVKVTGFLPARDLTCALMSCGAFVFPFISGFSSKNASLKAVQAHGTFAVTTSTDPNKIGYDAASNTAYVAPSSARDIVEALDRNFGSLVPPRGARLTWKVVSDKHASVYKELVVSV